MDCIPNKYPAAGNPSARQSISLAPSPAPPPQICLSLSTETCFSDPPKEGSSAARQELRGSTAAPQALHGGRWLCHVSRQAPPASAHRARATQRAAGGGPTGTLRRPRGERRLGQQLAARRPPPAHAAPVLHGGSRRPAAPPRGVGERQAAAWRLYSTPERGSASSRHGRTGRQRPAGASQSSARLHLRARAVWQSAGGISSLKQKIYPGFSSDGSVDAAGQAQRARPMPGRDSSSDQVRGQFPPSPALSLPRIQLCQLVKKIN